MVQEVDVPILMPGHLTHYVQVFPGDFIFADNDGAQGMNIDEVYRKFRVL